MPQITSLIPSPTFLQKIVILALQAKPLRLGLIPLGSEVSPALQETNEGGVILAEFNGAGWLRPTITIPSLGSYNSTNKTWALPADLQWSVTGPTGGIDVKQFFVIIEGLTTPRNTTGTFMGVSPIMASALTIPASVAVPIKLPWTLFGA